MTSDDIFGMRGFVENKGQFADIDGQPVQYALDYGLDKIYFTNSGFVWEILKTRPLKEKDLEKIEEGDFNLEDYQKTYRVYMKWENAQMPGSIDPDEKQSHYISYGEAKYNSSIYKKITYRNVYPNIDIEFVIPKDKSSGIKYSAIVHPGGNVSDLKIRYSGDVSSIKNREGEMLIKTPSFDLIEHKPNTFLKSGAALPSDFIFENELIQFSVPAAKDQNEDVIIDPWISSTATLQTNSYAYDVDYDFLGNTFVYGAYNPFKEAMYSVTGALQWCFAGIVGSQSWSSAPITGQASNFGVNRFNSKTYIGQGYVTSGNRLVRIDANGNYDNFINPALSTFQEVWDMGFHCITTDVFVLGGGVSSNISGVTINTLTAGLTLTTFQPSNNSIAQDVASHAIDDNANIFVLYASGITSSNNKIILVNSTFNGNIWLQPTTFNTFGEQQNKNQYVGAGGLNSNGFNALAVNANYLYYYDGSNLSAYNKTTGTLVANTTVPGVTIKQQGGIAVDDCDNLYIGGVGTILSYHFNGTSFSTLTPIPFSTTLTNQYVYDIKLDKQTKTIYYCGSGFAGVTSAANTFACPTASSMCLFAQGGIAVVTTSVSCSSLGTGTCSTTGGIGPFSYTWMPSGQTGSVATGLNPGNHVIVVNDAGNNNTYTTTAYLAPLVPLTGSVTNPVQLDCFGVNNGSAAVLGLAGGSGNQSYLWTNGVTSQTTPVATGLGPGLYTLTVIDALTSCSITPTFSVIAPPALSLTIAASGPTSCVNNSITMTPLPGGGTPTYSFVWNNGPQTGVRNITESIGGTYVYTLNLIDSKNCVLTKTSSITFVPGPPITIVNASICPLATGTLSASGAQSYTWNGTNTGSTFVVSPTVNTIYTVVASGSNCASTETASVFILPTPVATYTSNSPVCTGKTLQITASGGVSYAWNGPQNYSGGGSQVNINNSNTLQSGAYNFTVTAANTCTSSASANVTVHPLPQIAVAGSSVCVGQTVNLSGSSTSQGVQYLWTGPNAFSSTLQNPSIGPAPTSVSGFYTLQVTDTQSCISTAAVHASVTAMPLPSFTVNTPVCQNDAVQFNANQSTGVINYLWSGPSGFSSNQQNPSLSSAQVNATGIYTLTVVSGPCSAYTSASLTVWPLPQLSLSNSVSVCEDDQFTIGASSASQVTFIWHGPFTFSATSSAITRNPAKLSASGIYTVQIKDANSCVSTGTILADVRPNPLVSVQNVSVCMLSPAVLKANGAATYVWDVPLVYLASGQTMTVPLMTQSLAVVTVTGTAANSCTATAKANITAWSLPVPTMQVAPSTVVCQGAELIFEASGGIDYDWSGPVQFFMHGQKVFFTPGHQGFSGNYTLTAIDSKGCRGSTQMPIKISPQPQGYVSGNMSACVPFCATYTLMPDNKNVASTWVISGKTVNSNIFSRCFDEEGTFVMKGDLFDNSSTCKNVVQFTINAYPKPHADFTQSPSDPVENSDDVILSSTSQGTSIMNTQWFLESPDKKIANQKGPEARYFFQDAGIYPVAMVVRNAWGCEDTMMKSIYVAEDFAIYVPNAFTPNEDGMNEVFLPVMRAVKVYHLQIYDRWGAMIFESRVPEKGWDGTFKGEACKNDVYTWMITAVSKAGTAKSLQGHVTISR